MGRVGELVKGDGLFQLIAQPAEEGTVTGHGGGIAGDIHHPPEAPTLFQMRLLIPKT